MYLAPEIIQGYQKNKKSDFWSLGVLIHLLYYRNYPFKANCKTELYFNILNRNIITERNIKAPKSLKKLIRDLLVKNPRFRIGNNLEEFVDHPFFKGYNRNFNLKNIEFFKNLPSIHNNNEKKFKYSENDFKSMNNSKSDSFYYFIDKFSYKNNDGSYISTCSDLSKKII